MKNTTKNLTLSALFIALGLVLPFLTGQLKPLGNAFLPMHLPVLLCGPIVGPVYGLIVGLILPLLRHFMFNMPPLYPTAIAMTFELATYGLVSGIIYKYSRWKCIIALYEALIIAMILGRVVSGIANVILLGLQGKAYTFETFIAAHLTAGVPGIILQLVLIPAIMVALHKADLVRFHRVNDKVKTK